ncbi:hypothetical protein [Vreelandella zhaodongensis]|uniref:hypothetical protein n=1 Tax=Vreelandella zhaodongensis TaxID=1176240 RepID=UPI0036237A86
MTCTVDLVATSSGSPGDLSSIVGNTEFDLIDSGFSSEFSFDVDSSYLHELPGGCIDNSNCVFIGESAFLVDWDQAPDWFSYVDTNGVTQTNPNTGDTGGGDTGGSDTGGSDTGGGDTGGGDTGGGDTGGGDTGGGDTGGGDTGGSDTGGGSSGGGSSGGGSTVPDFELDDSGIIEAIGSVGRSNRDAINALSNDVTGAISSQTSDFNTATNAQTDALNSSLSSQTDTLATSLDDQTNNLTSAIEGQTGTLTGSLDDLGMSIVDAINAFGSGSGEAGEGEGEEGEGDGLLGGIARLLNGMVDDIASRFTEDLGSGDDLFNSSGLDDTLDGVAAQEEQHADDVNILMDEIGDGATSGIAEQVTSRLPSLPSGGCVPLQFGPMEITCQAFNTIKLWLTWIIYFWTVVSIIDTFFRSEQRTA